MNVKKVREVFKDRIKSLAFLSESTLRGVLKETCVMISKIYMLRIYIRARSLVLSFEVTQCLGQN